MIKLLNEVVNLVDQPNILSCKFDKKFLEIPKEILDYYYATSSKIFSHI